MVDLPALNTEMAYVNDVFSRAEHPLDLVNPVNYGAAVVDAAVSPLNLVLPNSLKFDTVIPDSLAGYHRRRGAFDAMTGIATVFTGVGLGTKASKLGGFADRVVASAGGGARVRGTLFADTGALAAYDDAIMTAMSARANAVALTGRTTPNVGLTGPLDEGAATLRTLTGADTYEGAAQWASRLSKKNGLKEALHQEAAIFLLGSQNEFLFPEDAGFAATIGLAAGGAALGVGVSELMRRTATRKTMATIGRAAGVTANEARASGRILTENAGAAGIVGEEWVNQGAAVYGAVALSELERNVDLIVQQGGGALSKTAVMDEIANLRLAYKASGVEATKAQFKNRLANKVLRNGVEGMPGVSREMADGPAAFSVWDRLQQNDTLIGALAELGDTGYLTRWHAIASKLDDDYAAADGVLQKALKGGDPEAVAAAQSKVDNVRTSQRTLGAVRPAVIEPYAVANTNPARRTPHWETPGGTAPVIDQSWGVQHKFGGLGIANNGMPVRVGKQGQAAIVDDLASLNFSEMTEFYTLLGKRASENMTSLSSKILGEFVKTPAEGLGHMPFPVLDAIAEGRFTVPEGLVGNPKLQQLQQAANDGTLMNEALAQKLDWWRANKAGGEEFGASMLDLMDAEKALNLRLTDKAGNPNVLGHAFEAFAEAGGNVSARTFMLDASGNANAGFDRLFDMGIGKSGGGHLGVAEALRADFTAGLKGIKAFDLHKPGQAGVGALYHRVDVPTDGEFALAKLSALRDADRITELTNSDSMLVQSMAQAWAEDPQALAMANDVVSLFDDINTRGNTLQQTQNQHRFQRAIQGAVIIEKSIANAHDAAVQAVLEPLAANVRSALQSPKWAQIAPQIANAHQAVSRGAALTEEVYRVGLNEIDLSRPGARRMLDELGELAGAPDEGDVWHMFDVSIAANQGRYVPIALTDEAASLLNQYADASNQVFRAVNSIRRSAGQLPLEKLKGHMPVMNFARYKLRYVQDAQTGRVVGFVKGRTDAEAEKLLREAMQSMQDRAVRKGGSGDAPRFMEATVSEIKQYYDAIDEVFLNNLRDFSGVKQGGTAGGRNADFRLDVSTDLAEDMMIALRNSFEDVKRRATAALFAPQMNEVRMLKRRIGTDGTRTQQQQWFTAVDQWQNTLLGDNRLPADSLAKKTHALAEDLLNSMMGAAAEATPYIWRALSNKTNGFATPAEARYAEQVMANFDPIGAVVKREDLAKYLKVDTAVDPYRAAKGLQMANRATAAALLKIANVAHPILNYAGVVVTTPAVLNAMKRMTDESVDAWKLRVGPMADYMDDDAGIATVNSAKLLTEGFHMMMHEPGVLAEANRRGMIEANMLEELNKLNNLRPNKFVDGVEYVAKHGDFINRWLTPLTEKVTGKELSAYTISERSETGSRAWVHMMGYALAKRGGVTNESARHNFAHYFANQNIANYSPNLRGQAFRGMAGIPFGLFQSYSINVYQRLFNYIGDGNKRALAVQAATQAGMFGISGLPGWDQLNAMYFPQRDVDAGDRGANLNERIYNGFGKGTADLLMAGSLSNLPRLLGGNAINLYTSGDMNLRVGAVPPAFSVMGQTAGMVSEGFKRGAEEIPKIFNGQDFDGDRLLEVIAAHAPMRGYRSLADIMIGERIDKNGNLLVENTRRGTALAARMLGTKEVDELATGQAIYSNAQAMAQRRGDMERLRSQMLRGMRDKTMTEDQLSAFMTKYIASGGRADQWPRWLNYTAEKAGLTRGDRMLEQLIGKSGEIYPHQLTAAHRLESAGVKPSEEMLARAQQ